MTSPENISITRRDLLALAGAGVGAGLLLDDHGTAALCPDVELLRGGGAEGAGDVPARDRCGRATIEIVSRIALYRFRGAGDWMN